MIAPRSLYKVYRSADEIQYASEDALKEGLAMVKALKASIKKVDLGSKMRAEVWQEEIKKYVVLVMSLIGFRKGAGYRVC